MNVHKLEDLLGKALLVGIGSWCLIVHAFELAVQFQQPERPENFGLLLTSQLLNLLFVAMILTFTILRLPPRSIANGIEPRLAAFLGSFLLMLLIWLPPGTPGRNSLMLANVLIAVGTLGSLWCLNFLGRSFAVMPSARELVTDGPYRFVRHPLYFAEAITCTGIVMAHWSLPAVLVGGTQLLLQFRRMQHEERVLRAAFPEYAAYAEQVPMIFARLRPADLSGIRAPAEASA